MSQPLSETSVADSNVILALQVTLAPLHLQLHLAPGCKLRTSNIIFRLFFNEFLLCCGAEHAGASTVALASSYLYRLGSPLFLGTQVNSSCRAPRTPFQCAIFCQCVKGLFILIN
jgi:hypothetical protein